MHIYILYMPNTSEEQAYLRQLTDKERKAYEIAKSHLGSSFHLTKSIGFQQWMKTKSTQ